MLIRHFTNVDYKNGLFVERKYDGIRAVVDNHKLYSRTGKEFYGFSCIEKDSKLIPSNYVIDGELYIPNIPLQEISGIVRSEDKTNPLKRDIKLYVFDIYDKLDPTLTQDKRKIILDEIFKKYKFKCMKKVQSYIIHDKNKLESLYLQFLKEGFEGAIIRKMDSVYEPGKRSKQVFKLKPFFTDEFIIVDAREGMGKDEGAIIFILETKNKNKFTAVPNMSYDKRAKMWKNKYDFIGKSATIQYANLSKDNIPQQPKLIAIRDYE